MPRLSLDARLDRLLAESIDSTRYRDFAMQLRRLTLSGKAPEGAYLTDDTGRQWIAGEVGDDGVQPVVSEIIGASTTAVAGTVLRWDGGAVTLQAEIIAAAGGQWDTLKRDWRRDGKGERVAALHPVRVDLMESQQEAARWFADRLKAFREQQPHPHKVGEMLSDRRAGKSFVGLLMVIMLAIDCPMIGSLPVVAWLVSKSHPARDELDRIIKAILPPDYYVFREMPKRMFVLANGATILHKTTDDVESLRSGYVDIALMNEAALMPLASYRILLRAARDRKGFLVLATNDPAKGRSRGNWVVKLADGADADIRRGIEPAVKVLRLDPKQNAAIDQEGKSTEDRALRYVLDEGEEIDEGLQREADDKCYSPPFSLEVHVRPLPQVGLVDITAELLKRLHGRPYSFLIGGDFQQQNAAVAFRIYAPSFDPTTWKHFKMWAVRGWFLRGGGDEDDLIDAMESDGFTADNCLVIGDSSGQWQKGDHGYGPVSFETFRRRHWAILPPTKKRTEKAKFAGNPDVMECVGKLRNLIMSDRFFVLPGDPAANVAKALHKCDARVDDFGNYKPRGRFAHLGDACRYPAYFLLTRVDSVATPLPAYVTRR